MRIRDHWINLLYRVATGTRKTRTLLTPMGILVFGAFIGLCILLAVGVDRWLTLAWPLPNRVTWPIAGVLVVLGLGISAWSVYHFLKVKGTPVPFNPPPTLVMSGPYQFVRNPMLTGVFLFVFGIGFAIHSLSLVVLFAPLFVGAHVWELKHIEEPELAKRLGDDYVNYQQRTPMFLPRIRSKE